MSPFKTKDSSRLERVKTVHGEGKKETTEENIIKSIINLFKLKKGNETTKE